MSERLPDLLSFALELARAAESVILPQYQRCVVNFKPDGSEVTEADRGAEAAMRTLIGLHYPEHAILGEEEGGALTPGVPRRWIIDPLDGTSSFAVGAPLFGTLVAYCEEDEPVLGVIHLPVLGETVYAARGLGCFYQPRGGAPVRVRVAPPVPLRAALVSSTGLHGTELNPSGGHAWRLTPVIQRARKFRFFSDCHQHTLLCRGTIHAAIDTIMQPWDIAALVPCIEEAGGVATTMGGQRQNLVFGGSLLTSCDRALHDEVLALVNG